ncbi:hypothetical protein [Qaidamihabitans albus]|uniref:hypothetical protein n=1 Tax=Qaidamihabitans albus TaxID=2795733 RepID=UPI001F19C957|nr:hypothetical protein [Qaidamihabitans albus]
MEELDRWRGGCCRGRGRRAGQQGVDLAGVFIGEAGGWFGDFRGFAGIEEFAMHRGQGAGQPGGECLGECELFRGGVVVDRQCGRQFGGHVAGVAAVGRVGGDFLELPGLQFRDRGAESLDLLHHPHASAGRAGEEDVRWFRGLLIAVHHISIAANRTCVRHTLR